MHKIYLANHLKIKMMKTPLEASAPTPSSAPVLKPRLKKATSSTHPKYTQMITSAVKALRKPNGSTRQAIAKYVQANYDVGSTSSRHVTRAIKSMVDKKDLVLASGVGAAGRFRIKKTVAPRVSAAARKRRSPKKKRASPKKKKRPAKRKTTKKRKSPVKKRTARKSPKKKTVKRKVKKSVKKQTKRKAKK
ncbi:histone H1.0-like [Clavelina lepadiformis]|uniref:histone H1.0-like n=1 Tax=Clavelina lepadiformis TaxID=159417 RepID=UPI004041F42E